MSVMLIFEYIQLYFYSIYVFVFMHVFKCIYMYSKRVFACIWSVFSLYSGYARTLSCTYTHACIQVYSSVFKCILIVFSVFCPNEVCIYICICRYGTLGVTV